ncbi:glycosyltransferase family 4 protein [Winogradskyella psychrotolerans]|uniref:glycosyltransferase family 4 protein n=1 Tax=Winogradskyella psychrotolerans TaxID=1344585 RepID=UPI001C076260|nr:glycosyltransferase family 4 protein [Winogradskyella psychrotolerans]MBU2929541.1 glycosyltransferase family 4 protein [Winogradskyella psychrotolerans]
MNKTILIVTSEFPPQPGGIGNHAYSLALYLSKNHYKVTVIADQRDEINIDELSFDAQLPFNVQRITLTKPRFLMYFNRVVETFKNLEKTDCIIATGKFSLWNVAFCSLFFKRKTMAVIHGTEVNFKSTLLKKAIDLSLKQFKTIVAVSNYTKTLVAHLKQDVEVIPNGISINQWKREGLIPSQLEGKPAITTVGRVSFRKGQLQVIKLLPDVIKEFPEIHYHCVGIPTEAEDFKRHAKTLGVADRVTFHGALELKELQQKLVGSDAFVMLSTESETGDVEGFGIAILEANALGIPAIGSKNCGIEDAIHHGKSGLLIKNEKVSEFSMALKSILATPEVYQQAAKDWAALHSWHEIIKRYIKVIEA